MPTRVYGFCLALVALLLADPSAQQNVRRVFAGVETLSGRRILDVAASEFHLTEDGVERPVLRASLATTPLRVVLLVDASTPVSPRINDFRSGLQAFADALPAEHEVAFVSVSGQMRVRLPPTTDRARLRSAISNFASDGGANVLLDAILESDRRFLRNAQGLWPVFVILTTDATLSTGRSQVEDFNAFLRDFGVRGGSAHGIVIQGNQGNGFNTQVVSVLTQNVGGLFENVALTTTLADRLRVIAARLVSDHQAMATRYELEYSSGARAPDATLEVSVNRDDTIVVLSARRPF